MPRLSPISLGNNLQHINEDGTVTPAPNEESHVDEPGHAALAIGEFFRATGEVELGEYDLFDLSARCVTQQAFTEIVTMTMVWLMRRFLASFLWARPKERNAVWERVARPATCRNNWIAAFFRKPTTTIIFRHSSLPNRSPDLVLDSPRTIMVRSLINLWTESGKQQLGFCNDDPKVLVAPLTCTAFFPIFIRQALHLHAAFT